MPDDVEPVTCPGCASDRSASTRSIFRAEARPEVKGCETRLVATIFGQQPSLGKLAWGKTADAEQGAVADVTDGWANTTLLHPGPLYRKQ